MKLAFPIILKLNEPNTSYKELWVYRLATTTNVIQSVVGTTAVLIYWRFMPPKIPLWFSKPWGEERLTHPAFLLVPILISIIIYIGNILIANKYTLEHPLFTRILFLTSNVISVMSLYIVLRILSLSL